MENDKKILTYSDLQPRYNNIGEWKPLIYTGDINALGKEVYELTKNEQDKRIYGALYYIKATSCNVIEFIAKTHFEIPGDFQQIGSNFGKIQLHKINFGENYDNLANLQIYDGTLELTEAGVEDIKNGLAFIDVLLHRLAFRLDTKIEWFIKYPHHDNNPDSIVHLGDEDMNLLKEYLLGLKGEDSVIFDVAISWYVNGNNNNNPFVKFLSYCIAMESLVDKFLSGKMDISSKFGIDKPEKIEADLLESIKVKHDELYANDPKKFVEEAYFDCIKGISKKLRKAMEIVFGTDHEYIKMFFEKDDKLSIYDLRSKLAHGSFTILDSEHKEIIEKRLPELKNIAYKFILRLSMGIPSDQPAKKVKSQHSFSLVFSNPKSTGIASTLNIFPNKDWRIRPEWLF